MRVWRGTCRKGRWISDVRGKFRLAVCTRLDIRQLLLRQSHKVSVKTTNDGLGQDQPGGLSSAWGEKNAETEPGLTWWQMMMIFSCLSNSMITGSSRTTTSW